MQIFLTGGSGLVGSKLVPALLAAGHHVALLTRRPQQVAPVAGLEVISGDPCEPGPWLERLRQVDAVIHLAGEPIFGRRWSRKFKERIRDSRVKSTALIAGTLAEMPQTPETRRTFISASAIGYYGLTLDYTEMDEASPPGDDFLAKVCVEWERAAEPARTAGWRLVNLRVGIVLDAKGGALPKMVRPFKWYLGGVLASGIQWMSWIHIDDMVRLIQFALEDQGIEGPLNAVGPEPMKNWGFCKTLGKVLHRPCWLPTPGFLLRIAVGPAASIVTKGQRVKPRKAEDLGFEFKFEKLELALRDLLGRPLPE